MANQSRNFQLILTANYPPNINENCLFSFLEKCITNHTGSKPRTIRTKHATTFIIEVSSHSESIAITVLDKIHNNPVQTGINYFSDVQKSLENGST